MVLIYYGTSGPTIYINWMVYKLFSFSGEWGTLVELE